MANYDMYGGVFSPLGYTRINEGGSHEENPNGGVQMGIGPDGIPNVVEEGESIYKDFVYSDNIKADGGLLKKHNLPEKFAGLFYSEVADKILADVDDMTTDEIALRGMQAHLLRLAEAQEEQKQIQEQKEIEEQLAQLSPEELEQVAEILNYQNVEPAEDASIMAMGGPIHTFQNGGGKQSLLKRMALASVLNDPMEGAVATASGWEADRQGNITQTPEAADSEGAKELRRNLRVLAEIPLTEMGLGLAGNAVRGTKTVDDILTAARDSKGFAERAKDARKAVGYAKGARTRAVTKYKLAEAERSLAQTELETSIAKNRASSTINKAAERLAKAEISADAARVAAEKAKIKYTGKALSAAAITSEPLWKGARAVAAAGQVASPVLYPWPKKQNESSAQAQLPLSQNEADSDLMFDDEPAATPSANVSGQSVPSILSDVIDWGNSFAKGGFIRKFATGSPAGEVLPAISVSAAKRTLPTIVGRAEPLWSAGLALPGLSIPEIDDEELDILDSPLVLDTKVTAPEQIPLLYSGIDPTKRKPVDLDAYRTPVENENIGYEELPSSTDPETFDWRRYADAGRNIVQGFYNIFQKPDKLTIRTAPNRFETTALPQLITPEYRPTDINLLTNDLLASGAGSARAIQNSGNPISALASLAFADRSLISGLGEAREKVDASNFAQRNAITGVKNKNILERANSMFNMAKARADYLSGLDRYNIQNDLIGQQYADQGLAAWGKAVSDPFGAASKFIQDDYLEDRRRKLANSSSIYGYGVTQAGDKFYVPLGFGV